IYGGWMWLILPYIEQDNLYRNGYNRSNPGPLFTWYNRGVPTFLCPSDPRNLSQVPAGYRAFPELVGVAGAGTPTYLDTNGNPVSNVVPYQQGASTSFHSNGIFDLQSKGLRITDITDGSSNTIMVMERPPAQDLFWGWWSVSDFDCLLSIDMM